MVASPRTGRPLTQLHSIEDKQIAGRAATVLASARVRATIVPDLGMLCSSLTLDGEEMLGHPYGVDAYVERGKLTGIPLMHPWANRLSGTRLHGAATDTIDATSPLIHVDGNGLPIHGLRLIDAGWEVTDRVSTDTSASISARLNLSRGPLLDAFPFPHGISVTVTLSDESLAIATTLTPTGAVSVPIAFGWHPYFRIPGVPRSLWHIEMPVRRRALLDDRGLPTGLEEATSVAPGALGATTYDDLFTGLPDDPVFALAGGGWRTEVAFGPGYPMAQVYAPLTHDVIALEPMTAPTNAVVSGDRLRHVLPGESFSATFGIRVSRS